MKEYLMLIGGWVLFFVLLSLLKRFRIVSIVFAIAGALAMLFYSSNIESLKFFSTIRWVSMVLTVLGVMVVQTAIRQKRTALLSEGIFQYVRQPTYAGVILLTVGYFAFLPNRPTLVSCLCILIYVPIGIYFDEKRSIKIFGDQYLEYRKDVPVLIPDKLIKEIS